MTLTVINAGKEYTLQLEPVSQWCGTNIMKKQYIISSVKKYFSSSKYAEYEKDIIDNVFIDGELVGRKYFSVHHISAKEDLISGIKMGKSSMMGKYIFNQLSEFNFQSELEIIEEALAKIFDDLNTVLMDKLGDITLDYEQNSVFDMALSLEVRGNEGEWLEKLPNEKLIKIYLELLNELQKSFPEKKMIIFENMDHLVSVEQYKTIYEICQRIGEQTDSWFVFTTSIPGYVFIDRDHLESVTVINDEEFILPDYMHLLQYINDSYPYYKIWEEKELLCSLEKIVHNLCNENQMLEIKDQVVEKMINESMGYKKCTKNEPKLPELVYLRH